MAWELFTGLPANLPVNRWSSKKSQFPSLITKALDDVLEYEDILTDSNLWWNDLKQYLKKRKGVSDWRDSIRDDTFRQYLSDFLHHEDGAQSKKDFKFEGRDGNFHRFSG